MLQKTFALHDEQEVPELLKSVRPDVERYGAGKVLLQLFADDGSEAHMGKLQTLIRNELPDIAVIGASLAMGDGDYHASRKKIFLSFLFFQSSGFQLLMLEGTRFSEAEAGQELHRKLRETADPKAVLLLPAGMGIDVQKFLVEAYDGQLKVPIFGTQAGVSRWDDPEAPQKITLFINDSPLIHLGFAAVILTGRTLDIRIKFNLGWKPIGKAMTVTGVDGIVLQTIDGIKAIDVYRKYLGTSLSDGDLARNLSEFPLILRRGQRNLSRIAIGGDGKGGLVFPGDIEEGDQAKIAYGSIDEILSESYEDSLAVREFDPQAVMLIVCGSRKLFMHLDAEKEITLYEEAFPQTVAVQGFSEILYDEHGGGSSFSALVSVAMKETDTASCRSAGQQPASCGVRHEEFFDRFKAADDATVPLYRRLSHFLTAISRELEESVQAADAASRAKGEFLSRMSHEIRTPINAVLGLDEMILRESREENILGYARDIKSSGRSLLSIINDILDFSKIEAGKMDIIPAPYDLRQAITDITNMTEGRALSKGLSFLVDVDITMPHLLIGDEARIKQCAVNILTNAIKYTEQGFAKLAVSCERRDESHIGLRFRVTDSGIGIKPEDLERLYRPFERIEESRNRNIEGTGLGMNIVNGLLMKMGTQLEVRSEYGKGSDFSFIVLQEVRDWEPIGTREEAVSALRSQAGTYRESFQAPDARILVVDDTPMNLTVIRGLLKRTRIQLDTAEDAAAGLMLAHDSPYQLIFIDHLMPGMDGLAMLSRLRQDASSVNRDTPCVILTANAISGAREQYLAAGFSDYLSKPVDPAVLESLICRLLPEELVLHEGDAGFVDQSVPSVAEGNEAVLSAAGSSAAGSQGTGDGLFRDLFGLDIAEALRNCGGKDFFLTILLTFCESIPETADALEASAGAEDWVNYTILVHSLKSSARLVGAVKLSEAARELEQFGKLAQDGTGEAVAQLRQRTPGFLKESRASVTRLAPLCNAAARKQTEG
ncbi:MAG: response regulator [Treponema sp.]|nr:response regulator [Treponema sp.]